MSVLHSGVHVYPDLAACHASCFVACFATYKVHVVPLLTVLATAQLVPAVAVSARPQRHPVSLTRVPQLPFHSAKSELEVNGNLNVFNAPSPLGPWTPHKANPVKNSKARKGQRPAGRPLVVDGQLYRFGQDCSTSYGYKVGWLRGWGFMFPPEHAASQRIERLKCEVCMHVGT